LAFLFQQQNARRNMALFSIAASIALVGVFAAAARPDNPAAGDSVGAIEGEAIAVTGPMSVENLNGGVATVLHSGSDVRVKSGTAHIKLVEGGQIAICGPAHFSVLKSGNSLTIALDTGTIHVHIERTPVLTMYTPQIQAQPVAIGGGPQDTTVGFDASGAMCVRTNRGALRLEQQLNGQSVLVPQGGSVFLANGQIDSLRTDSGEHCSCDLQLAEAAPPLEVSRMASSEEVRHKVEDVKPNVHGAQPPKPVAPKEEPVYQVFVPPLIFNANSKVQPEIDPKMIMLIRRVRVRPTLIFQGKVEGDVVPVKAPVASPPPPTVPPPTPAPVKTASLTERVRNFFRKLWPFGS
jgi:hypothetical protein